MSCKSALLPVLSLALLTACDDRPAKWEEILKLAKQADEPGGKLAECMATHLKPSAAFKIGYVEEQFDRANATAGLEAPDLSRGASAMLPMQSHQLLLGAAEALAVHCGVDRSEWKARPLGVSLESLDALRTERGVRLLSYEVALSRFTKHVVSTQEYVDGRASAKRDLQESARVEAAERERRRRLPTPDQQILHDFAVSETASAPR